MIYFLQDTAGGPVKIGYSANVSRRHRQLEARYRRPLAVLATMKGGRKEEAEVHARFSHIRLKGEGSHRKRVEQFRPTAELMEFIGRPLLVGANPDVVEAMAPKGRVAWKIEAGQEWLSWLDRAAKFNRTTPISLIDQAVAKYVRDEGFDEKPPKR